MTADELRALAARVEAATGADRELDVEIAVAVTPGMFNDGGCVGFTGRGDMRPPPHFTASLDAALTLVPEGCRWELGFIDNEASAAVWRKMAWRGWVCAATPALALVAAALRARAEELTDE